MVKLKKLIIISVLLLFLIGCEDQNGSSLKKIETDFTHIISPVCFENDIFMAVSENDDVNSGARLLIKYNIATKEYEKIFESEFTLSNIQGILVNENWIVWQDMELYGKYDNIWVLDRKKDIMCKISTFSSEEPSFTVPVLYENYIIWIEEVGIIDGKIQGAIKKYDCITGKCEEIDTINEVNLSNLFIRGYKNRIIWSDQLKGCSYYCIYEIDSKEKKRIRAKLTNVSALALFDKYIICEESDNKTDLPSQYYYTIDDNGDDNQIVKLERNLNGYYALSQYLVANNGQLVLIYMFDSDGKMELVDTINAIDLQDYYVGSDSSLILIEKPREEDNKISLYIYCIK